MHKKENVIFHRQRISEAVKEVISLAVENQETEDDIISFLCNGKHEYGHIMFGPGMRGLTDRNYIEFLIDFMNSSESEEIKSQLSTEEDYKRLERSTFNIELMIYSHIWESQLHLSNLKHFSNFIKGNKYDWQLDIPWQDKWSFITKDIRSVFEEYNLKIIDIMKESYHSQLRNAFAHSQYGILENSTIQFFNYTGKDYEIAAISFEEWEDRFLKTVELFTQIANQKHTLLKKYSVEKPTLKIWTPKENFTKYRRTQIYWDKYSGYYSFNKNALRNL